MLKKISKISFIFFISFMLGCNFVFALDESKIECKYDSTPSLKPKETFTLVANCTENKECKITYTINGKSLPLTATVDTRGWTPSLETKECSKFVGVNLYEKESKYDGRYDDVDITEAEEVQETGVYVVKNENNQDEVRIHIGFILKNQNYTFTDNKLSCGNVTEIPKIIPKLTSLAVTIVQIAVPVILVLMGSLDLFKGITAGKEDEMKKGQQMFIKRLIVGAIIFFVVVIVKFVVSIVADTNVNNIVDCIDCFVSNDC